VNIVVDTNVVFSTLLNPHSSIGEVLMNVQDQFTFFAPELLKEELERYDKKISNYTKLNQDQLIILKSLVLSSINFISEDLISKDSWNKAFNLTADIDEDDTPFVALALELKAKLWTGDKLLAQGLERKGHKLIIGIKELSDLLK